MGPLSFPQYFYKTAVPQGLISLIFTDAEDVFNPFLNTNCSCGLSEVALKNTDLAQQQSFEKSIRVLDDVLCFQHLLSVPRSNLSD